MTRLDGQVAVVTGGNRGIGLGLAPHRGALQCDPPGLDRYRADRAGQGKPALGEATVTRTPVRRWGRPSDLRDIAAYLADPALVFHTADSIVIDGGYSIL